MWQEWSQGASDLSGRLQKVCPSLAGAVPLLPVGFDILAMACHQLYFNLARPNSHKGGLSPWQILHQLDPRVPIDLCLLPPVFLDYRLNHQGGYDLPRRPYQS